MRITLCRLLAVASAVGVLVAAGVVVVASSSATTGSRPSTERHRATSPRRPGGLGEGLTSAQLLTIAERVAASCGDHHPYHIEAVRTTRGAAGRVIWPGGGVGADSTPVYAITMRGKFRAYQMAPPGGRAPNWDGDLDRGRGHRKVKRRGARFQSHNAPRA